MTEPDDIMARLRENAPFYSTWLLSDAADAIASRDKEIERLTRDLRTVQNAAKTITSCHETELEHLRQNYAFDHKLRAEVESLREANSLLTEQTDAAEARAETAERELDEAQEQLRMQWCLACGTISADGECDCTSEPDTANLRQAVDYATEFGRMVREVVRERDEARAEVERLKGLLWYSWHEFNAIKARHGAPVDHYLMLTVDPEYWEQLTKAFAAAIGPEDAKPWPSTRARAALQQSEVKP